MELLLFRNATKKYCKVVFANFIFVGCILLRNVHVRINPNNLIVSESCPLILNVHKDKEKLFEDLNGNRKIGTTNKGIRPCYEDKVGRRAIRLCDLENADELNNRVDALLNYHNAIRKGLNFQVIVFAV
jgi:adenylosuccinate synthase